MTQKSVRFMLNKVLITSLRKRYMRRIGFAFMLAGKHAPNLRLGVGGPNRLSSWVELGHKRIRRGRGRGHGRGLGRGRGCKRWRHHASPRSRPRSRPRSHTHAHALAHAHVHTPTLTPTFRQSCPLGCVHESIYTLLGASKGSAPSIPCSSI